MFDKLNICLQVQEWVSSSMLKLNCDKAEFITIGSPVQLKKLDSHLSVRIFGNFIHAAVLEPWCLV